MVVPLTSSSDACQKRGRLKGRSLALMGLPQMVRCPCFVVLLAAVMLWPPGSGTCRSLMWVRLWTTVTAAGVPDTCEAELLSEIPLGTADNMESFVAAISERVKIISNKARENHANRCGMLANCTTGNHRSRLACGYRKGDNYTCLDGFEFDPSLCTLNGEPDKENRTCKQLNQIFDQTFVRYPLVDGSIHPMVNDTIIRDTCTQSPLHEVFYSCVSTEVFKRAGGLYFGSVSGIHWGLPGLNQFIGGDGRYPYNCREKTLIYDPRHRPWFKQASSPRKQVSVLVDLTNDIGGEMVLVGNFDKRTKLDVVRTTIRELAKTFQESDDVALTVFPSCNSTVETFREDDSEQLSLFKKALEEMQPAENSPTQDLADGIKCALSQLSVMSASDKIRILLVFTRGRVNVQNAISYIKSFQGPLFVFFYGVDLSETPEFSNLSTIASAVDGVARTLNYGDPLLGIYSYFDFLASFYRNTTEPYLCREYKDAFNLKNITTSILPVYDDEGHFVGVAGMDIRHQVNPGAKGRLSDLSKSGTPEPNSSITSVQEALNLPNCTKYPCYDERPLPACNNDVTLLFGDVLHEEGYMRPENQLLCCRGCLARRTPLLRKWWYIPVIVVAGLLTTVFVVAFVVIAHRRCCKHCSWRSWSSWCCRCGRSASGKKERTEPRPVDIISVPTGKY